MNDRQFVALAHILRALRDEMPHNETITHNCVVWLEEFQDCIDNHGFRCMRVADYDDPPPEIEIDNTFGVFRAKPDKEYYNNPPPVAEE